MNLLPEFLFLNFTTSDRNPTTAMSNLEILGQDKFNEFTKDKLVLVDIYMYPKAKLSPADRKRNESLAEQYGVVQTPARRRRLLHLHLAQSDLSSGDRGEGEDR